jgi:hypothetical protein
MSISQRRGEGVIAMPKLWQRGPGRPPKPRQARRTAVSLSADDLAALGALLAAGRVLLADRAPKAPALARIKAAMTRLGVPVPPGL